MSKLPETLYRICSDNHPMTENSFPVTISSDGNATVSYAKLVKREVFRGEEK